MNVIVVGAGISGLATAHALLQRQPGLDLAVLEAAPRTGGKVWTEHSGEGYACEWGVNGFLDKEPRTLALAAELGLKPMPAAADAARRYVWRGSKLHRLPESPPAFLTSGLLSLKGRLRVLCEPLIARGGAEDESLADFARRRLGEEALKALIDPMASGVFAGNPERMSLASCFPRIREIEQRYGSLIRGMIRLQLESRRSGKGPGPGPGPGGRLTSFAGGMSELTDGLTERLGPTVRTATPVESLSPGGPGYQLHLPGGETLEAERVILAAPAWAQAAMLRDWQPQLASLLGGIDYPPLAVACLGYKASTLPTKPDGFGFLIPSSERRALLGTIFDSNVFAHRAPQGSVLLRSMIGGSRAPERAMQPEAEILDSVQSELKSLLGITAEPELARVYRHRRAIPQYHVGHAERLAAIETELQALPGLHLTGNAFRGVSLNDCVANAEKLASALLPESASASGDTN